MNHQQYQQRRLVAPHFHHFWSKRVPLISLEITLYLLALRCAIWSLPHFFLGRCGTFSRFLSNQENSKNSKSFWKKNDGAQNPEGFPSVFLQIIFLHSGNPRKNPIGMEGPSMSFFRASVTKSEGTSKDWNDSNHLFVVDSSFKLLKSLQNKSDTSRCSPNQLASGQGLVRYPSSLKILFQGQLVSQLKGNHIKSHWIH